MAAATLRSILRERGYRVTPPRELVWQVLESSGEHLTAEEILVRTGTDHGGQVNLASVYRSLSLLEELGLIRASRLGDGSTRWEVAHPDEHFHLVCRGCGAVDHHVGTLVESIVAHLQEGHGFVPEDIELVVTGLCPDCAA